MAKNAQMTYPLDQPRTVAPATLAPENMAPGNAVWMTVPPEAPVRAHKGDLGLSVIRGLESRALTTPGAPFIITR